MIETQISSVPRRTASHVVAHAAYVMSTFVALVRGVFEEDPSSARLAAIVWAQ